MKFAVYIQFERTQCIEVEAETAEEAKELVQSGEFDVDQIIGENDTCPEVTEVLKAG